MSILYPAPPWQPDRSEYVILWHGCTVFDKNNIEKGIDLTRCRVNTDFGRGFYTTTLERQARQWAWQRYYDWVSDPANAGKTGNQPVVLRFRVRRYGVKPRKGRRRIRLDDGLDKLLSLHFVVGDHSNEDFWSLVQYCRQSTSRVVHDHRRPPSGWYDVVTGPVAALWKQRVALDDTDQVSFHTKAGVALLDALIRSGTAGNKDDYRWEPVP